MKKLLAIISFLLISTVSLIGCGGVSEVVDVSDPALDSSLGLRLETPDNWSVVFESDTSLKIQNDVDEEQFIIVNKFENDVDEEDVWLWYEASSFPTPVSEVEEITVDGLLALSNIETHTVIVPYGIEFYMIQDCLSLSCNTVEKDFFIEVVASIEFTD